MRTDRMSDSHSTAVGLGSATRMISAIINCSVLALAARRRFLIPLGLSRKGSRLSGSLEAMTMMVAVRKHNRFASWVLQ